jgi:hypothetical protein
LAPQEEQNFWLPHSLRSLRRLMRRTRCRSGWLRKFRLRSSVRTLGSARERGISVKPDALFRCRFR